MSHPPHTRSTLNKVDIGYRMWISLLSAWGCKNAVSLDLIRPSLYACTSATDWTREKELVAVSLRTLGIEQQHNMASGTTTGAIERERPLLAGTTCQISCELCDRLSRNHITDPVAAPWRDVCSRMCI